jgi:hypothetical protein
MILQQNIAKSGDTKHRACPLEDTATEKVSHFLAKREDGIKSDPETEGQASRNRPFT